MSPPPSPSGSAPPGLGSHAALIVLIGSLAVLRLLAAGLIPLTEDEAYYRLWSQHLALGYYDHPPMIAWWIRAGTLLAGDDALGVRLLPALSNLAVTLIVFDLGRMAGDERTGFRAALFYNCTLTVGVGAGLAVPDVPAGLFWSGALWALAKAATQEGQVRWWMLAGGAAGLAALSKYSALFLAPGVVLWLALSAQGRRQLLRPWPWLAAAIAVLIFSSNIAWNASHHWETFAKQFGRAAPGRLAPRYLLEFLAGQFLLLNPAVAILAGLGGARAWRMRLQAPIAWLMLAAILPFLAYLVLHSLHDRVQAHWPVPLYSAAAVLAAWAADPARGWRANLSRWAPLGLVLSVVALLHMDAPSTDVGPGDPALALRDWRPFASRVEETRLRSGAAWTGTLSYGVSAQLQAAQLTTAPVVQLNERDRYADLPPKAPPDLSRPGLVIDLLRRVDPNRLKACFTDVGPLTEIDRGRFRPADSRYGAVVVSGPKTDLLGRGCGD
jgi:4-amino-4-deoxy-L-arabinose transferase-like glycosyltransferase